MYVFFSENLWLFIGFFIPYAIIKDYIILVNIVTWSESIQFNGPIWVGISIGPIYLFGRVCTLRK